MKILYGWLSRGVVGAASAFLIPAEAYPPVGPRGDPFDRADTIFVYQEVLDDLSAGGTDDDNGVGRPGGSGVWT